MMASHLSDGCHKPGERVNCSMEVYLSTDFGKAWRPVTSYVAQFDWAPAVDGVLKPGMQKESMFLVTYEKKEGARAHVPAGRPRALPAPAPPPSPPLPPPTPLTTPTHPPHPPTLPPSQSGPPQTPITHA